MKKMTQTTTLAEIDLSKCEPHPLVKNIRFDYTEDIEKLCELIHINGQKLPGIVVPVPGKEGYYWVIAGNRRMLGCKLSNDKYGEPRTFLAIIIKSDLSDQDIVISAYVENLSGEDGGRKDLCFLEEYYSLSKFDDKLIQTFVASTNATEEEVKRKVELIRKLGGAMVMNLHKIERHVPPFYFEQEHIEWFLSHQLNYEKMLKIASLVVEERIPAQLIDGYALALKNGVTREPEWLHEMFPDIKDDGGAEEAPPAERKEPPPSFPFLKDANMVSCYACHFTNPFEPTLKGGVSFLNPPDPIHQETMEPISLIFPPKICWNCHTRFSTKISMGKNGARIVTSIPPVEEDNDEEEGAGSSKGVLDYIPEVQECKEGCQICHLVLATKEGRFKLDHATGLFTVRAE
jgi:ParB-like chromosome segregation protein Spo0J